VGTTVIATAQTTSPNNTYDLPVPPGTYSVTFLTFVNGSQQYVTPSPIASQVVTASAATTVPAAAYTRFGQVVGTVTGVPAAQLSQVQLVVQQGGTTVAQGTPNSNGSFAFAVAPVTTTIIASPMNGFDPPATPPSAPVPPGGANSPGLTVAYT